MLKYALTLLLLTNTIPVCSNEIQLPCMVDYGPLTSINESYDYYTNHQFNFLNWKLGGYAFNYAPELTPFFAYLKKEYNVNTVIETGTFFGGTTVVFSSLFDKVHTIEIQKANYDIVKELFRSYSNVQCHLGSSEEVIKGLLSSHKDERVLFYLDAHWNAYWPLLNELEEISKTHQDNCIIVIDDFKVPGRWDIPYDIYEIHECSLEYIQHKINKIFTSYTVHFLIPKSILSRAKVVIIPNNWK